MNKLSLLKSLPKVLIQQQNKIQRNYVTKTLIRSGGKAEDHGHDDHAHHAHPLFDGPFQKIIRVEKKFKLDFW